MIVSNILNSKYGQVIAIITVIIAFSMIFSMFWTDETISTLDNKIQTLEKENEIIKEKLAHYLDVITGYKDQVRNLKLRPVVLENEIKYWVDVHDRTRLDVDLLLHIQEKCIEYDVNLDIVLGMIQAESNFDSTVVNYNAWNDTYDRGLMQINSGYEEYYWNLSNIGKEFDSKLISNSYYNIELGISYLKYQLDNFNGYYIPALGAYNMGYSGYKNYTDNNSTEMTQYASKVLKYSNNFMKE